jgi:hypothetical protein
MASAASRADSLVAASPSACTTISETSWPTASCSSRAMRSRSPLAARSASSSRSRGAASRRTRIARPHMAWSSRTTATDGMAKRLRDRRDALDRDALGQQPPQQLGDDLEVARRVGGERRPDAAVVLDRRRHGRHAGHDAGGAQARRGHDVDRPLVARGQRGDRALGHHPAAVDDRREVARLLHLVQQMRREQHRAALRHQRAHQPAELENARRVEPVDRLVQDQQLRVAEQAAGDAEPLAHAERVRLHAVVGSRGQPDALQRAGDPPRGGAVARRGVHLQVLAPGQVRVEARLLDDRADPGQGLRAARRQVVAEQPQAARARPREAEQQPHERRLAGAVAAEEAERAAARHLQVDRLQRRVGAEALPEALGLDGERGHGAQATAGPARPHPSRGPSTSAVSSERCRGHPNVNA